VPASLVRKPLFSGGAFTCHRARSRHARPDPHRRSLASRLSLTIFFLSVSFYVSFRTGFAFFSLEGTTSRAATVRRSHRSAVHCVPTTALYGRDSRPDASSRGRRRRRRPARDLISRRDFSGAKRSRTSTAARSDGNSRDRVVKMAVAPDKVAVSIYEWESRHDSSPQL